MAHLALFLCLQAVSSSSDMLRGRQTVAGVTDSQTPPCSWLVELAGPVVTSSRCRTPYCANLGWVKQVFPEDKLKLLSKSWPDDVSFSRSWWFHHFHWRYYIKQSRGSSRTGECSGSPNPLRLCWVNNKNAPLKIATEHLCRIARHFHWPEPANRRLSIDRPRNGGIYIYRKTKQQQQHTPFSKQRVEDASETPAMRPLFIPHTKNLRL